MKARDRDAFGVALYRSLEDSEQLEGSEDGSEPAVETRAAYFFGPQKLHAEQVELWRHRGYPERSGVRMNGGSIDAAGEFGEIDEAKPGARCEFIDGARAFPPEDCGGTPGYANLLVAKAEANLDHGWAEFLEGFDPEPFDAGGLKARFRALNA